MTGDYTKVPLRTEERWTSAPMQQARVLLDHEWNLNLSATGRARRDEVLDVIGPAGVAVGSEAFEILAVTAGAGGSRDLELGAGHGWVGGLEPYAPARFHYTDQDQIPGLPTTGKAFVWLDVFDEHVQPAEDPGELVDPALAPIDSAARTRVGWRVRAHATSATSCTAALQELGFRALSDASASISRTPPAVLPDPCAPPGDPLGVIPDGLLRVEVLDRGTPATARLAWAFDDGADAVAITQFAGKVVTLAPSFSVKFATGDRVEVSWLARRQDRLDHGPLYTVQPSAPGAGGDVLTLDQPVPASLAGAAGLCVRRWDGEVTGATTAQVATLRGTDLGVRFQLQGNTLEVGDWWGARLREAAADPVEVRTDAPPDGTRHAVCPLGMIDLDALVVLEDCRPTFKPLVGLEEGAGVCTVTVQPGDDLQAAFDLLPADGGEVCVAAGLYPLDKPVIVSKRQRVVLTGVGPAAVIRAVRSEAAIIFDRCTEIGVDHVRIEGGRPAAPGDPQLNGALTFIGSIDVRVSDCTISCPDAETKTQACITMRAEPGRDVLPDRVRIDHNEILVGGLQIGVLLVDVATATVESNRVRGVTTPNDRVMKVPKNPVFVRGVARLLAEATQPATPGAPPPVPTPSPVPAPAPAPAPPAGGPPAAVSATPGAVANPLTVLRPGSVKGLATAFTEWATPERIAANGGVEATAHRFVRTLAGQPVSALQPRLRTIILQLAAVLRPALQGIVVGGRAAGTVQVLDNIVEGTIQGIHIGASDAHVEGREAVDEVIVSRNVVHAAVPQLYDRERHAVFVGNAGSVHITDTVATLVRPDLNLVRGVNSTPVEAIRVFGVLGPFLLVRQTSARGFNVGVRVTPLAPQPSPKLRLWLVAETMAAQGVAGAVLAPGITAERNIP